MELVQEDVGPDEIFQRERVQTEEKGEAALSLNFAATFRGKQRRGGQRRSLGRNGQRGRRETGGCDAS